MRELFRSNLTVKNVRFDVVENFGTASNLSSLLLTQVKARHLIGFGGKYEYRGILYQAHKHSQHVKKITTAAYVTVFINTAKFLHVNESRRNYDAVDSVSDL